MPPVTVVQRTRRNRAATLQLTLALLYSGPASSVNCQTPLQRKRPTGKISALRYCRVTGLESKVDCHRATLVEVYIGA